MESEAPPAMPPASDAPSTRPPTRRLIIRVKLVPEEPVPPPIHRRLSRGAWLLVIGVVVLALCWAGFTLLRTEPTAAPATTPVTRAPEPQLSVSPQPDGLPAPEQPERPLSPVDEVIPDVPQSALDTIRGTVRVSVLVTIDKTGTVLTATADDPGPSRYFERLSLEAAKQWTFTPATSDEQRSMLLKFHYTRGGVEALARQRL